MISAFLLAGDRWNLRVGIQRRSHRYSDLFVPVFSRTMHTVACLAVKVCFLYDFIHIRVRRWLSDKMSVLASSRYLMTILTKRSFNAPQWVRHNSCWIHALSLRAKFLAFSQLSFLGCQDHSCVEAFTTLWFTYTYGYALDLAQFGIFKDKVV